MSNILRQILRAEAVRLRSTVVVKKRHHYPPTSATSTGTPPIILRAWGRLTWTLGSQIWSKSSITWDHDWRPPDRRPTSALLARGQMGKQTGRREKRRRGEEKEEAASLASAAADHSSCSPRFHRGSRACSRVGQSCWHLATDTVVQLKHPSPQHYPFDLSILDQYFPNDSVLEIETLHGSVVLGGG